MGVPYISKPQKKCAPLRGALLIVIILKSFVVVLDLLQWALFSSLFLHL